MTGFIRTLFSFGLLRVLSSLRQMQQETILIACRRAEFFSPYTENRVTSSPFVSTYSYRGITCGPGSPGFGHITSFLPGASLIGVTVYKLQNRVVRGTGRLGFALEKREKRARARPYSYIPRLLQSRCFFMYFAENYLRTKYLQLLRKMNIL